MTRTDADPTRDLWPPPRRAERTAGRADLARGLALEAPDGREARRLAGELEARGLLSPTGLPLRLAIEPGATPPQGYRLVVGADEVRITCADDAGAFHAGRTLLQLLEDERPEPARDLPCVVIDDAPDRARRGVMLDVSRDRVPRTDELHGLVERLAALKINELQLYTEHTFAYPGHPDAWRDADPFTPEEIAELDAHCRALHVELVPNQQSFGHLHRWLKLPRYAHLAELPAGIEHPFSDAPEPFGLCPTDPAALAFLEELYDALLPCFSSGELHVGLDETLDLGLGRSRAACAERGRGRVYTDFLRAVHARVAARGKRMLFWADEVEADPELARRIPTGAVAMIWGYEAGHPFAERARAFREAGLELRVCPGTSTWQSFGGRTRNALANLTEAAAAADALGATGLLTCDWGDRGHPQPPAVSEAWLALAAGSAWNAEALVGASDERLSRALDRHVFRDPRGETGRLVLELGRLHEPAAGTVRNGTAPFFLLHMAHLPHPCERTEGLDRDGLAETRARAERIVAQARELELRRADAALVRDELRWAARAVGAGALLGRAREERRDVAARDLDAELRARLDAELAGLVEDQRTLWLARSRPGGLADSLRHLERARAALGGPFPRGAR